MNTIVSIGDVEVNRIPSIIRLSTFPRIDDTPSQLPSDNVGLVNPSRWGGGPLTARNLRAARSGPNGDSKKTAISSFRCGERETIMPVERGPMVLRSVVRRESAVYDRLAMSPSRRGQPSEGRAIGAGAHLIRA